MKDRERLEKLSADGDEAARAELARWKLRGGEGDLALDAACKEAKRLGPMQLQRLGALGDYIKRRRAYHLPTITRSHADKRGAWYRADIKDAVLRSQLDVLHLRRRINCRDICCRRASTKRPPLHVVNFLATSTRRCIRQLALEPLYWAYARTPDAITPTLTELNALDQFRWGKPENDFDDTCWPHRNRGPGQKGGSFTEWLETGIRMADMTASLGTDYANTPFSRRVCELCDAVARKTTTYKLLLHERRIDDRTPWDGPITP